MLRKCNYKMGASKRAPLKGAEGGTVDFRDYIRSTVGRTAVGVEFGASYNPIVPKKDGYNVYVVDHSDETKLREIYAAHAVEVSRIEPVDAIDDGGELTNLLPPGQRFDYVIASHVFEHLPDPIRFLQRCERALKPGGKLFLLLPDRRFTFDFFRPVSSTGDLLRAYLEGRTRHDPGNLFDHYSMSALKDGAFIWTDGTGGTFTINGSVPYGYAVAVQPAGPYVDCHAWVFTPPSFRLILSDLRETGLTTLGESEFFDTVGCEFFMVLTAGGSSTPLNRLELAHEVLREANQPGVMQGPPPAAQPAAVPPAAPPAIAAGDVYESRAPSAQTAVDALAGSWVAAFPESSGAQAGTIPLHDDARIRWLIEQAGGVAGQEVLELGPLEASHTAMLLAAGASRVLAVEANRNAYLKCLVAKEVLGLDRASFLLGDFTRFLEADERRWPAILASGVLYHMEEPLRLLERIAERTDRLLLWTHVVDDAEMPEGDPRRAPILKVEEREWRGRRIRHYLRPYAGKNDPKFCGGITGTPAWLNRDELLEALKTLGFDDVRVDPSRVSHEAGPSVLVYAGRSAPAAG